MDNIHDNMKLLQYNVRKSLRCYVNCIMTDGSDDPSGSLAFPLYADGYPGIMYQKADNGLSILPTGKKLSQLFLYGQTLHPATLSAQGKYKFVVLQLYPFASKYLLNMDPKALNDECYDLFYLNNIRAGDFYERLLATDDLPTQIEIMSDLVEALLAAHMVREDDRIQTTIHEIIQNKGLGKIRDLSEKISLTERTFERKFMSEVGLTPKQFAKIVQFQNSLEKIGRSDTGRFTEVAFDSGYADQSHFIRVFKSYTGLSPKQYRLQAT